MSSVQRIRVGTAELAAGEIWLDEFCNVHTWAIHCTVDAADFVFHEFAAQPFNELGCKRQDAGGKVADIQRWDIIVYKWPKTDDLTVKRVAGLPGETIEWSAAGVTINGTPLKIPDKLKEILKDFRGAGAEKGRQQIPADAVFVIGDRIEGSKDSRYDGPVKFDVVKGKVVSISSTTIK